MNTDPILRTLKELLAALGVSYSELRVEERAGGAVLTIEAEEGAHLIGEEGETLRALTYLLKRIVERAEGEEATHFLLDVNGYQAKKLDELKRNTTMLAERARALQSPVALPTMNSYERMVIHDMFSNDPDLTTHSEGLGKERHIVITPKDRHLSDGEMHEGSV